MGAVGAFGGIFLRAGTFHVCGCRTSVPDGVECPRPEVGRVAGQARASRIWCQGTPPWFEADRPSSTKPRRA